MNPLHDENPSHEPDDPSKPPAAQKATSTVVGSYKSDYYKKNAQYILKVDAGDRGRRLKLILHLMYFGQLRSVLV